MSVIQRGLASETGSENMISQAGHHGGGSQLCPNQCFVNIKTAGKIVLSLLRTLSQVLSSICFRRQLLVFLYTMAFILAHAAHGEEQTGICKPMDPSIICDRSSVVNFETLGLCPCSSTEQLPAKKWVNSSIPRGHPNMENHSPDPLWLPIPSRANAKVVVVTVLAIFGGIGLVGLAGWLLYKRRRAFTEADINRGLMRGPAVVRRSDPTFETPPHID